MRTIRLFLFLCIGTIIPFITACNNEDNYDGPHFEFDAEGYCYLPTISYPHLSHADFLEYVVGNAWEIKEDIPINEKGKLYEEKYEQLGGSTPAMYLTENDITMYSKSGKYLGHETLSYNYSTEKNLLVPEHGSFFIIFTVTDEELIMICHTKNIYDKDKKYNYRYQKYRKLTKDELQQYKELYTKEF